MDLIRNIAHYLGKLVPANEAQATMMAIASAIGGFLASLESPHKMILGLVLMVVLDLATGIRASLHEGKPLTSYGLRRSVDKMVSYGAILVIGALFRWLDLWPGDAEGIALGVLAGALCAIEAISVLENVRRLKIRRLSPVIQFLTRKLRMVTLESEDRASRADR